MSPFSLPQGGIRLGKSAGNWYWLLMDLHTFKVIGEDTNGAFTVAELTASAEMGSPPRPSLR